MKTKARKITIIAMTIVVGLVATASASFACCGNCMGYGIKTTSTLTVEQQQKLDATREKYSPQLDQLQSALSSKTDEYSKALTNDDTTVGTLNRLEAERVELERQYGTLLDQANEEAGKYVSGNSGPWFGCNYNGCNHQNHMASHSNDRHMGQNQQHGMHRSNMTRCWQ